jgi:hypothetical protein
MEEDSEQKPTEEFNLPPKTENAQVIVKKEKDLGGYSEIALRNHDNSFRIQRKDASGKFIRSKKTYAVETKDITRMMRQMLMVPVKDKDGRITKESKSLFVKGFENLADIMTADSRVPVLDKFGKPILIDGKPLLTRDSKMAMASIKAYQALMERGFGKVQPGDEEMDALRIAGVKIVVVSSPELMNPEVVKEKPKELGTNRPSFIEAEIVENKS